MYEIRDYVRMAADAHRLRAYFKALEGAVHPGDVVLDLGTGVGLFAMHAARLGASKVYAIDSNPVVHLAARIAAANGLADNIEFIEGDSLDMSLPEKVDVIVSDLRGVLPLHFTHLPAIVDARRRWLKPGGRLIPPCDRLLAALVNGPETHASYSSELRTQPFDLSLLRRMNLNTWRRSQIRGDQIVSDPRNWFTLNYATLESSDAHGDFEWTIETRSFAHGLGVWYKAELGEDAGFSTAPGEPETVSGTGFFPFLEPLDLQAGDTVQVSMHAKLVNREYVWAWKTLVTDRIGKLKTTFDQCTLSGDLVRSPKG